MKFAIGSLVPALAAALVLACDADLLGPKHPAAGVSAASRATAGGLGTSTLSPSMIEVTWVDGVANEAGWEVHRSTTGPVSGFTLRASLPANTTAYTDSTLASGTEYCYQVRSFRTTGPKKSYAAFSNVGCSSTFAPPPAPSNVNAVPRSSTIIDISWTDNSNNSWDGEQGFRVERAGDAAGPWQSVASLGPNTTYFAAGNGITPDQEHCYRVIAVNPYGESPSDTDCTAAPRTPTGISATSANGQSIDVGWVDASSVEDGYEVQRASDGVWQAIANLSTNANGYHDAAISADAVYEYRIRAKRDGGFSDFSGTVTIRSASRTPDAMVLRSVVPAGSSMAHVGWEAESPLATDIRVERSTDGQATWVALATFSRPSNLEFYDAGLNPEEEVCYRVFARNALGDSPPSNVDCTIPPAAPTNLSIAGAEGEVREVTWTDNSQIEEGYLVVTYVCSYWAGVCDWWEETVLPANTTTISLGSDAYGRDYLLDRVCAIYEGRSSDCAVWSPYQGTSAGSTSSTRMTTSAPAPRSPLTKRQGRVPEKRSSPRRTP